MTRKTKQERAASWPNSIVAATALTDMQSDLEARRQRLQEPEKLWFKKAMEDARESLDGLPVWAGGTGKTLANWQARALKAEEALARAEAAVLKYPEWVGLWAGSPFCYPCSHAKAEGHAPDCLRAELEPQKVAVAWCKECEHYTPEDEVGTGCPGECGKKLVRRLGYIHEDCEERTISFTRAEYSAHVRSHESD